MTSRVRDIGNRKLKTLITGAAGFIGSHLTDRLLGEGRRVVGLDNLCNFYDPARKRQNLRKASAGGQFALIEADIRDREAVMAALRTHQPSTVIHLAAMAGVRPSIADPSYYAAVNVDGTVNLLDAALEHGVERFIFASSSSVYGNNPKMPFAEDDNVDHPISPYAATKKAGELICHSYWHVHRMPVGCLRFFTVYGPRQRPDLAIGKFLRLVRDDQVIPLFGDGSTSRDYTFIDDIVGGIIAAMERLDSQNGYRIWNLGGNRPVTLSNLVATIERVTGRRPHTESHPMQPGDVQRTWADLSRSKAELGYEPTTSLEEGIAVQWRWICGE